MYLRRSQRSAWEPLLLRQPLASCEDSPQLLFTENETNKSKLFNAENDFPYVKDGINDYIVHGVKTRP